MQINRRHWIAGASMFGAAGLSIALTPKVSKQNFTPINLESLIPKQFGPWRLDQRFSPIMPPPDQQAKVKALYDETLARSYVNADGQVVMLSIAYGGDQTGRLRVHRPESCYAAQGFLVKKVAENQITTPLATIPVKRLMAISGQRYEPITYWIRVGDATVTNLMGQRITQLRFGITGEVPDGLIFRISTIDRENARAYAIQDRFVSDLMQNVPEATRHKLIGNPNQAA